MRPLYELTIHELNELLKNKEIKSVDITNSYIERIKKIDPLINSYLYYDFEQALESSEKADNFIKSKLDSQSQSQNLINKNSIGRAIFPELSGIPLSIKDIFLIKGKKTTCASRILENFNSPYDSTVIKKLKENNFVFLGKTNMDEFAMGSSTENSAFKTTKNPWDVKRVPGGSSGGSAASVSADLCAGSFGTDTGGSIRQPASLCGVTGLKPTYGMISRHGIIAFSSSLDQAGPIAKDVLDSAILLKAVAGYDKKDQTSRKFKVKDYPEIVKKADKSKIKGLKIGLPVEFFSEGLEKDIYAKIMDMKHILKDLGAEVIDISLPDTSFSIASYYVIATSEASSNLERYDGIRYGYRFKGTGDNVPFYNNNIKYSANNNDNDDSFLTDKVSYSLDDLYVNSRADGFGKEVKRRIMLGTFALSAGYYDAYYKKASLVRKLIIKNYKDAFSKVDLIIGPTSPTAAFLIGEKTQDPLSMYLSDIYTISVNLAYLPAMSLPIGVTGQDNNIKDNSIKDNNIQNNTANNKYISNPRPLPIGLHIIAPWCAEDRMLETAKIIEDIVDFRGKFKPLD